MDKALARVTYPQQIESRRIQRALLSVDSPSGERHQTMSAQGWRYARSMIDRLGKR